MADEDSIKQVVGAHNVEHHCRLDASPVEFGSEVLVPVVDGHLRPESAYAMMSAP